jgi:hypothetical protein
MYPELHAEPQVRIVSELRNFLAHQPSGIKRQEPVSAGVLTP